MMFPILIFLAKLDEDDEVALEANLSVDGLMKASSTGALLLLADDTPRGSSLDHDLLGSALLGDDRLGRLLDRDLLDKLLGCDLLGDLLGDGLLVVLLGRHPPGSDLLEASLSCLSRLDSDLLAGLLSGGGSLPGNDLLGGCSLANGLLGEFFGDLGCRPPDTDLLAEFLGTNLLGGLLPDELLGDASLDELLDDTLLGRPLSADLLGDPSGEAANPGIILLEELLEPLAGLVGDDDVPILE